jgi:hypothetical protein
MTRTKLAGAKPPVGGACRYYRTAPGNVTDAFEYVAAKLRDLGCTPVEQDYTVRHVDQGPESNEFFWVELWAIPPARAAGEAL